MKSQNKKRGKGKESMKFELLSYPVFIALLSVHRIPYTAFIAFTATFFLTMKKFPSLLPLLDSQVEVLTPK